MLNLSYNHFKVKCNFDIVANEGDEVYAFANGVISYKQDVDTGDSKGICIAINHHNPDIMIEAGLYATSIYMHLSSIRNLKIGTFVEKGQLIGYMGHTGECYSNTPGKNGTHLHFAVKSNDTAFGSGTYALGEFEDPMNYRYCYE